MINKYTSDKIRVFSFLSIIFVLYIHSGFHADEIMGMKANDMVQTFVSGMIGRCAVPLFYIISGFFFFLEVPDGMVSIYEKIRRRERTLLIPYIIGCLFFVCFLLLIELMPWTSHFVNSGIMPLFRKSVNEIFYSVFYDAGNGSPCAFQLWFLRDLIVIVATSPLWYLCLKYFRWGFVTFVFILTYFHIPFLPSYALFWFVFGGQLSETNISLGKVNECGRDVDNVCFRKSQITIISLCLFMLISIIQLIKPNLIDWELYRIPIIMIGILASWNTYDMFVDKKFMLSDHSWLATACQFTFFIYLFHEPTLNIVRKLIVVMFGNNELGYMISYLLSPWLFIFFAVIAGLLFQKYFPKFYCICTGGR